MNFTFKRVIRDCPANVGETNPRNLINDFDVIVDGERRAVWMRNYRGKGYELFDVNHEPVLVRALTPADGSWVDRTLFAKADKQDDFAAITEGLLLSGRIPTADEASKHREGWGRALLIERDQQIAKSRRYYVGDAADAFYAVVLDAMRNKNVGLRAAELLDAVDRKVLDSVKQYDERELSDPSKRAAIEAFVASQDRDAFAKGGAK